MIKTARQLKDLIRNLSMDEAEYPGIRVSIVVTDLQAALLATAHKRGTERYLSDAQAVCHEIEANPVMEKLWAAYQKKFSYAADLSWETVMDSIRRLYSLSNAKS